MISLPLLVVCLVLALIGGLALLPLIGLADPRLAARFFREPILTAYGLGGVVLTALVLSFSLGKYGDAGNLTGWGRIFGSVLQVLLAANLFVAIFAVMLWLWPKGGAVAMAAFRESLRQPMFWLLLSMALFLMVLIPLLPYFTLGEDQKMVKELGYETVVLFATLFAILAASTSISEEIEGRTAVTLMSKPVSRRQFLLGKFIGILLASLVMVAILGWAMTWMLLFMDFINPPFQTGDPIPDPAWLTGMLRAYAPAGLPSSLLRGLGMWVNDVMEQLPGLAIVSFQVMVMLSIATALATRLTMVVNVPVCMVLYVMGHLAPVLMQVSEKSFPLVYFMAQVFNTVLPGLEHFQLGAAIVRDQPLRTTDFAIYTAHVGLYALLYTSVALLFGLILFEDRDLA